MSEIRRIHTTRFGVLEAPKELQWSFPRGLIGLETATQWVLLGESESSSLVWLQSVDRAELALPLVSPRRLVPGYKVRVSADELTPLELSDDDRLFVLVSVAKTGTACTADLRGPLLFNATRRRGVQVVTLDEQPLQYILPVRVEHLKRSA